MPDLILALARGINRLVAASESADKPVLDDRIEGGPDEWVGTPGQGVRVVPGWRILEHEPYSLMDKALQDAFGNPKEYRTYLRPIVERFAEFVQLLPASANIHHIDFGGLLQHCLEVAIHALNAIKELDTVLPPGGLLADHEIAAFAPQVKTLIATHAIGHDLAKITTSMKIEIFSETKPTKTVEYDDAPDNYLFSQSLYEAAQSFAQQHGYSPNSIRYRWSWNEGSKRAQHDDISYKSAACLSLLKGTTKRFADLLISIYIPGCVSRNNDERFEDHAIHDHHAQYIKPLIDWADRKSSSAYTKGRYADPRTSSTLPAVRRALKHGARLGLFEGCPSVGDEMFVSTAKLVQLMESLHHDQEFAVLPQSPDLIDTFIAHLRPLMNLPVDEPDVPHPSRYYKHEGERGVLFDEDASAMIRGYQTQGDSQASSSVSSETQDSPSQSVDESATVDEGTDIAGHGVSVSPPPPEEQEQSFAGSTVLRSQPMPLYHSFEEIEDPHTRIVLVISAFLESLTVQDLDNPELDVSIIDERLTIAPTLVSSITTSIHALQLGPFSAIEDAANRYTQSQWRLIFNDHGSVAIVCSKEYTKAILGNDFDNHLIIVRGNYDGPSLRSRLTKLKTKAAAPSSSKTTKSKRVNPSPPPPTGESESLSLKSFFSYLRGLKHDESCQDPPRWRVQTNQLFVAQELVDHYIGDPSRRGQLMDMLRNAGIAVTRTSRAQRWTLTFTTDEAKKWLSE